MAIPKAKLIPSQYFHIYNRGIDGTNIFLKHENYQHFLATWATYIEPIAETYAYCLLSNHFHALVRIRDLDVILKGLDEDSPIQFIHKVIENPSLFISNQFGHCFNSYAQSINHRYGRTSGLFEGTFSRIWVDNAFYYANLIHYIHKNPEKHGFVEDYKDYPHSSYNAHLSIKPTLLMREAVLSMFGGTNLYEGFHKQAVDEKLIKDYIIEKD